MFNHTQTLYHEAVGIEEDCFFKLEGLALNIFHDMLTAEKEFKARSAVTEVIFDYLIRRDLTTIELAVLITILVDLTAGMAQVYLKEVTNDTNTQTRQS